MAEVDVDVAIDGPDTSRPLPYTNQFALIVGDGKLTRRPRLAIHHHDDVSKKGAETAAASHSDEGNLGT
jgi:hypothetical protein